MSDILVHIDQNLDTQAQANLENQLLQFDGVRKAAISPTARHLMVVDFEHDKTSSLKILHAVQKRGYQAELIGL